MDELPWSDYLLTGNEIVDFQHKKLFDYLNILIVAEKCKDTHPIVLKNALDALIEYINIHFEDEEILHKSIGYSDLVMHKKMHDDFTKQVLHLNQRFQMGEDVIVEFIFFIKDWILVHIRKEDKKAFELGVEE